jgi:hypothetical protein
VGCCLFNFDPALTLKELSAALEDAVESHEAEQAKVMQGLSPVMSENSRVRTVTTIPGVFVQAFGGGTQKSYRGRHPRWRVPNPLEFLVLCLAGWINRHIRGCSRSGRWRSSRR